MSTDAATATATASAPSAQDASKDAFHDRLSGLCNEMVAAHGHDFAIGSLVLAARFIAERKPFAAAAGNASPAA